MEHFRGKRAVVTGAGSGIGRALAQALSAGGATVYLSDVDEATLDETQRSLAFPQRAETAVVDVADAAAVQAWADAVGSGNSAVDLVVNNAGVALVADAMENTAEDFHWLMNINFWGVVHGCQSFMPLLERSSAGRLVNMSSIFGLIGVPTQSAYNAAKFAVRGYSEALRQELALAGSSVKLCCVHPGGIGTNIARSARNVDPSVTPQEQHEAFSQTVRTTPERAAELILKAAAKGKPRLLIGYDAHVLALILRFFPVAYASILQRLVPNKLTEL